MKLKKAKPVSIPLPESWHPWMSNHWLPVVIRSWLAQGFFYMIPLERCCKVVQTLVLNSLVIGSFIPLSIPLSFVSIIFSVIGTHTLNWLFSGQFWVVMTYLGYKTSEERVHKYLHWLRNRCRKTECIEDALLYGSISRGTFKATSDIDLRIISGPGNFNLLKAALFTAWLRAHSFLRGIPLDVFLFDDIQQLSRMNPKEQPLSLCQNDG